MDTSPFNRSLEDSNAVQLTGKIMMVAVLVLFLVVVFVMCLHLYAKYYWWRADDELNSSTHNRSRRRRGFVFAPGQDSVATTRKGLDPLVLRALPVVVFPSEDFKDGLECAVCLSELVQGEKARLLPKCSHGFHVDCIDMWFQSHSTCPLCRNPVAPPPESNAGAGGTSNTGGGESDNGGEVVSAAESLVAGFSIEIPNFPTNVLFWGNQNQVSSGPGLEDGPSSSASGTTTSSTPDGMLVIDVPSQSSLALVSPSPSPSGNRFAADEDLKSPVTTRMRSLKRLLSRDRRISPCSPSSVDVEHGGRGQS